MRQGLAEAELLHTQVGLPTLTPTLFLPILVACPSLGQRPITPVLGGHLAARVPTLPNLDVLLVEDAVLDGGLQRPPWRGRTQGRHSEDLQRLMTVGGELLTLPLATSLPLSRSGSCRIGEGSPAYTIKELERGGESIPYFSLGVPGILIRARQGLRPPEGR